MNVLIVGSGKGSFEMRAVQLGAAIGATVTSAPTGWHWQWADLVVLVKRAGAFWASAARTYGVPIVWDALDFWRQPADHPMGERDARALLGAQLAQIRPALTIGATQAMADAAGGVYLPHHSWKALEPTPAREHVSVVAYEGNPIYLGAWHARLQQACAKRGWSFVVNPPDLRAVDILVAFRDGPWDGYLPREWKSGVKVGNAIAAGRPILGHASAALRELAPPQSVVNDAADLDLAFDWWTDEEPRAAAVERCRLLAPSLRLEAVAQRYTGILQEALCAA